MSIDEIRRAANDDKPYIVHAEGSEAKHIIDLLTAEAEGRLVVREPDQLHAEVEHFSDKTVCGLTEED